MSIRVNSGAMLLGRTSGFQGMNGIGSWSYLGALRSDTNDYAHMYAQTVENDEIAGDYTNSQFIGMQADGTTCYASSYVGGAGAGGASTVALTVNAWGRHTLVRESATVLKHYFNNTLIETINQDVSGRAAQGGEWFGRLNGGYPADMAVEGFICWSVALTAGEVATQAGYQNPAVQLGNVTTYVPMTDAVLANALVAVTGANLAVIFGTPVTDTNSGYPIYSGGSGADLDGDAAAVASAAGAVYTPQVAAPIADIGAGTWVASGGGSLFAALDEAVPSDADFIRVPAAGSMCELRLAALGDPLSSAGHVLRYRLASPAGNPVRFTLRQGAGTPLAEWTENPGAAPADFAHALSGAEADSITDYTDLRCRIEALP